MQALYHYFYQRSDERTKLKGVRIVNEYSYHKFFWDTFGIAPHDMDKYDPDWLRLMAMCGGQENQAQADRLKAKRK